MKNGRRRTQKFQGVRSPLGDIFAPTVVSWFIFVKMEADEDVARVCTCERRDVTKFGLPQPWDDPPRRLNDYVYAKPLQ